MRVEDENKRRKTDQIDENSHDAPESLHKLLFPCSVCVPHPSKNITYIKEKQGYLNIRFIT